jgi:polyphosphate kinase
MPRNFLRRVEAVFPIEDPEQIKSVLKDLETSLLDNEGASSLKKDGSYAKVKTHPRAKKTFSVQQNLIEDSEKKSINLVSKNSATTSRKTKD